MTSPGLRAESQRIQMQFTYSNPSNKSDFITITNAHLDSGKWANNVLCDETQNFPNGVIIDELHKGVTVLSCGRENALAGAVGYLHLADSNYNDIYEVKFSIPYIGSDTFELIQIQDSDIMCVQKNRNLNSMLRSGFDKIITCRA